MAAMDKNRRHGRDPASLMSVIDYRLAVELPAPLELRHPTWVQLQQSAKLIPEWRCIRRFSGIAAPDVL
jgi:hypothetical protein